MINKIIDLWIKIIVNYYTWGSFIVGGLLGSFAYIGPLGIAFMTGNFYFLLLYLLSPILYYCGIKIFKD